MSPTRRSTNSTSPIRTSLCGTDVLSTRPGLCVSRDFTDQDVANQDAIVDAVDLSVTSLWRRTAKQVSARSTTRPAAAVYSPSHNTRHRLTVLSTTFRQGQINCTRLDRLCSLKMSRTVRPSDKFSDINVDLPWIQRFAAITWFEMRLFEFWSLT